MVNISGPNISSKKKTDLLFSLFAFEDKAGSLCSHETIQYTLIISKK